MLTRILFQETYLGSARWHHWRARGPFSRCCSQHSPGHPWSGRHGSWFTGHRACKYADRTVTTPFILTVLQGSSVICGALFGVYGARTTSNMVQRHTREIRDLAIVPVHKLRKDQESLAVRLCVSGWLTSWDDVIAPWTVFGGDDTFALQWVSCSVSVIHVCSFKPGSRAFEISFHCTFGSGENERHAIHTI